MQGSAGKTDPAAVSIESEYYTLKFPQDLYENVRYMKVTEGSIAMDVFYMASQEAEKELYRICYGDGLTGTLIGYLNADGAEIPVTFSVCEYTEDDFADEAEWELYHNLMSAFNTVMKSVQENPDFSFERFTESIDDEKVKLRYWTVKLPENVLYEESETDGSYRVDFYGMFEQKRIDLYYLGLGEMDADSVLGYFTVNGQQMPVVIGSSDLLVQENWTEEEKRTIYNMMESINTVIEAVTNSNGFSRYEQ